MQWIKKNSTVPLIREPVPFYEKKCLYILFRLFLNMLQVGF